MNNPQNGWLLEGDGITLAYRKKSAACVRNCPKFLCPYPFVWSIPSDCRSLAASSVIPSYQKLSDVFSGPISGWPKARTAYRIF